MKNKTPNWFSENQVLLCPGYKCNFQMNVQINPHPDVGVIRQIGYFWASQMFCQTEAGCVVLIRAWREPCRTCQTHIKSWITIIIIQIDLYIGGMNSLEWPSNTVVARSRKLTADTLIHDFGKFFSLKISHKGKIF